LIGAVAAGWTLNVFRVKTKEKMNRRWTRINADEEGFLQSYL